MKKFALIAVVALGAAGLMTLRALAAPEEVHVRVVLETGAVFEFRESEVRTIEYIGGSARSKNATRIARGKGVEDREEVLVWPRIRIRADHMASMAVEALTQSTGVRVATRDFGHGQMALLCDLFYERVLEDMITLANRRFDSHEALESAMSEPVLRAIDEVTKDPGAFMRRARETE